jgi:hypothetical protein
MNTPPAIPWLVQHAANHERAGNVWATVIAPSSQEAALKWVAEQGLAMHALPFRVRVGPIAPVLRHKNGMPMVTREFLVSEARS